MTSGPSPVRQDAKVLNSTRAMGTSDTFKNFLQFVKAPRPMARLHYGTTHRCFSWNFLIWLESHSLFQKTQPQRHCHIKNAQSKSISISISIIIIIIIICVPTAKGMYFQSCSIPSLLTIAVNRGDYLNPYYK